MRAAFLVENRNHVALVDRLAPGLREAGVAPSLVAVGAHQLLDWTEVPSALDIPRWVLDDNLPSVDLLARGADRIGRHRLAARIVGAGVEQVLPRAALAVVFNDVSLPAREYVRATRVAGASVALVQDGFVHFDRRGRRLSRPWTIERTPGLLDEGYLRSRPDLACVWGMQTARVARERLGDSEQRAEVRVVGSPSTHHGRLVPDGRQDAGTVLLIDQCFVRYNQLEMPAWTALMDRWLSALADRRGFRLTVRLHPSQTLECADWLRRRARHLPRVSIEDAGTPIETAIARHSVVAGFYSTVLVEALMMGACVLALDDPALSMFLPPIGHPRFRRADGAAQLGTGRPVELGWPTLGAPDLTSYVDDGDWVTETVRALAGLAHGTIVVGSDRSRGAGVGEPDG